MVFIGFVKLDRILMHASPRKIRKRIKTRFNDVTSPRKSKSTKIGRSVEEPGLHLREPAIFALRFQRTCSREARLALSSNGQRLPPYIRTVLRTKKAAGATRVPSVTIAPTWPSENPGLERVDRLLAEVRELGKRPADVPPFNGVDSRSVGETVAPEVAIALAPPPSDALPAPEIIAAAPAKISRKIADRKDRQFVEARALEDLIAGEVKARPGCEAFVGVLLEKVKPKSSLDTNWDLLGVKFGKSDRKAANEALGAIVVRMKTEFRLQDELK